MFIAITGSSRPSSMMLCSHCNTSCKAFLCRYTSYIINENSIAQVVETIRQIWGQASTPPQFQLSRTVEQTWAKAIPPQALPQKMGVKGVGGRETTTIKKVWEEQLPEKNPDPPPDPVFDSSALIMMKTLFPRAGAKIPARRTLAQRVLAKRAMRALAQQTSTPLKSDFIVLCPMKNELDKSASKLILILLFLL